MSGYMTITEFAEFIRKSKSWVREEMKRRRLTKRYIGKQLRFVAAEAELFCDYEEPHQRRSYISKKRRHHTENPFF